MEQTNENSNRTEILECYGKGYDGLRGQILQKRYVIGEFIDQGGQGKIYSVIDTKKDSDGKVPLIIKFSEDYEAITEEISILKKLRKEQKNLYGPDFRGFTPHCVNFGMLVMSDDISEGQSNGDPDKQNAVLIGYFVMKRYDQTLD